MSTSKIFAGVVVVLGALGLAWVTTCHDSTATKAASQHGGFEANDSKPLVFTNAARVSGSRTSTTKAPGVEVSDQDHSAKPVVPEAMSAWKEISREVEDKFVVPANWSPPVSKSKPTVATPLPHLDPDLDPSGKLAQAMRWFESLPDPDPEPAAAKQARSKRMAAAGLESKRRECRGDICLLSFRYSKESSERLRRRLGGRGAVHGRQSWLSITTIGPDGRVEGHVFMRRSDENRRMK